MSDYKTPNDKLITNEQAAELNACYREKQNEGFGAENDTNFSCSSWYSLEDLEGYINYVKEQALKKKISVDGIRFYFGVYPENAENKSKAGQNTLFMCPTSPSIESCSKDVTGIHAMNYGDNGNPPQNEYGD
ncbi:hypothetical protein [Kordia jejudonensis]|uniref:hypothetical protein n=1 Tax=Kordia jejudonensis TaxID=1348245 RepID=UPI00069B13FB|nr:hypothetical protein [Kordia jejudonensis]